MENPPALKLLQGSTRVLEGYLQTSPAAPNGPRPFSESPAIVVGQRGCQPLFEAAPRGFNTAELFPSLTRQIERGILCGDVRGLVAAIKHPVFVVHPGRHEQFAARSSGRTGLVAREQIPDSKS